MKLPQPLNPAAERIVTEQEKIKPFLTAGTWHAWLSAVIMEMNRLKEDTDVRTALTAAVNCAMLGLPPGGSTGYCYFVNFNVKRQGAKVLGCQLIPGYHGYIELAYSNNFLKDLHTEVVVAEEEPEFRHWTNSDGPQIEHQVVLDRDKSRQNIRAAYCLYTTKAGGRGIKVIDKREIEEVAKEKINSKYGNPWKTHYAAMAEKTAILRAAKRWKKSPELALALRLDDQAEIGLEQTAEADLEASNELLDLGNLKEE